MTTPPALQQFIDDELLRAPLVIEQTVDAVLEQLGKSLPALAPGERAMAADLMQALKQHRPRLVEAFTRALRDQVPGLPAAPHAARPRSPAAASLLLSLVDEAEVAVDVEMSHAIEAIKSVAEADLRELQTYTAALVGDMDMARDHNPFGAAAQVRALWAAAQQLSPSRGVPLHFMRQAGVPLAGVLRKAYAAACARLESAGVAPAAYRTLILPAGARTNRSFETRTDLDLQQIRESMPPAAAPEGAADQPGATSGRPRQSQHPSAVEDPGAPVDRQLVELLGRLFDAIVADRRLPPDIQLLLSRLQSSALRVVLRDRSALDDHAHPVWQFLDRIAFQADTLPATGDAERSRMLRHAQGIVEHVIGEASQDADLYRWAMGRLQACEQHRLERRCADLAGKITTLQQLEERLGATVSPPFTLAGALDLAQLDTVPAELFETAQPVARGNDHDVQRWLAERRSGDWLRLFLQGRWVHAQLVWTGDRGEVWLLADGASPDTWAVRRGALLALRAAQLLHRLAPRSLVRTAARQVLQRVTPADGS